jgi:hypothetical protein
MMHGKAQRRVVVMDNVTELDKCAHPSCKCRVSPNGEFGKFCSEHCREAKDLTELKCDCGHPGCN